MLHGGSTTCLLPISHGNHIPASPMQSKDGALIFAIDEKKALRRMTPLPRACHAVGAGDPGLESEDYSRTRVAARAPRCPPVKPKRHPSTRLSASVSAVSSSSCGASDPPGFPPTRRPPAYAPPGGPHAGQALGEEERHKKSDSGELGGKKGADGQRGGDSEDEPVYIEMVGKVFPRESQAPTRTPPPHPHHTPDSTLTRARPSTE
ncbi:unnamed protein product [Arctogadus glacialis]